jgi:hypothetical protein
LILQQGLTKTSASSWIFDIEFFKNIFVIPRPTANMTYPLILISQKKLKIDGSYWRWNRRWKHVEAGEDW